MSCATMTGLIEAPVFVPGRSSMYVSSAVASRSQLCRSEDISSGSRNALTSGKTQDEPRIYVESEDQPDRMLLETRIVKDDGYQKQQGTKALCACRRCSR